MIVQGASLCLIGANGCRFFRSNLRSDGVRSDCLRACAFVLSARYSGFVFCLSPCLECGLRMGLQLVRWTVEQCVYVMLMVSRRLAPEEPDCWGQGEGAIMCYPSAASASLGYDVDVVVRHAVVESAAVSEVGVSLVRYTTVRRVTGGCEGREASWSIESTGDELSREHCGVAGTSRLGPHRRAGVICGAVAVKGRRGVEGRVVAAAAHARCRHRPVVERNTVRQVRRHWKRCGLDKSASQS